MFAAKFFSKFLSLSVAGILFALSAAFSHADEVTAGSTVMLSVTADGTAPFSYQWLKNGINLIGSTGPTLTIPNIQNANSGSYSVNVANTAGSTTSDVASITVVASTAAPVITTQPSSQSVTVGTNVIFTASATGEPTPTYQWKKNGVTISGAMGTTLNLTNVQSSAAATYTVVATNSVGSVTSSGAVLTIAVATSAPVITTQPVNRNVTAGATVTFTAAASGSPNPTYQWKKNGITVAGATSGSLTLTNTKVSDSATYTLVATNSVGSAMSNGAVLSVQAVNSAPVFSVQPLGRNVKLGANVTFTAVANGSPAPTYQWYKGSAAISGATETVLTLFNVQASDLSTYKVVATNSSGSATSAGASLTLATGMKQSVDFNGDGQTDIIWRNEQSGEVAIWLMSGTEHVSDVSLGIVSTVWSIAGAADFNSDGQTDILWRNSESGALAFWLMKGTVLQESVTIGTVPLVWKIVGIGEFSGDGQTDILWRNTESGDMAIWVMNGVEFQKGFVFQNVPLVWKICGTGDFNGDGKTDILWRNTYNGDVALWVMDGVNFQQGFIFDKVALVWDLDGTGDFNGDGKTDILWRNTYNGDVALWVMDGTAFKEGFVFNSIPLAWQTAY